MINDKWNGGIMARFEYQITAHVSDAFEKVGYFCTEEGECSLSEVPKDQVQMLMGILNEQGRQGWELVQLSFGRGGILAFWKRMSAG
jgi:hypothetical protein